MRSEQLRGRDVLRGGAVGLAAGLVGVALGVLGGRFGALAVLLPVLSVVLCCWSISQPLVAAGLVALALPLGDTAVASLSAVQIASLLATGLLLVSHVLHPPQPRLLTRAAPWVLLLFVSLAASLPRSPNLAGGVAQSAAIVIGGCFALALPAACRRLTDLRRLVDVVVVLGGVTCGLGLLRSGTVQATDGGAIVQGSTGLFSEHNQAGSFGAAIAVLALGALLARPARERWLPALALLAALVQLGLALSRGAWIGFAVGVFALLVLQRSARRTVTRALLPLALVAGVVATTVPQTSELAVVGARLGSITNPAENPYDDRPAIYAEGLREFEASPWLGQGPKAFPYTSARSGSRAQTVSALHAHNVLLTTAAELGVLGLVAVVGLTLAVGLALLRGCRRAPTERDAVVVAGVAGALATFLGQGLVDMTLRSSYIATTCWLLVGLALAADRLVGQAVPGPSSRRASAASG